MSQLQVTGEAKIRDIQGPVVANSGVITALDGAASQYVRGDGTLADFPTSTGGGSSVSYYLNSSVSQGTIGGVAYRELSKEPIIGAGTDITISANGYVASYITDANDPDVLSVPGGNFNCEFYFSVNNNTGNPTTYAELYKYDGTTFTLLGSSQAVPESLNQGTTIAPYYFAIPVATAALALTDRLAIRIYVSVDGRVVTLHTENSHLCQVVTTFSKGMVSLNNLTDQSQFITTGTSGTDFNIVSSGDTHTFNLPVASATNTGKLSNTDWSTFNNKVPYTGATGSVDLGNNDLTADGIYAHNIVATKDGIASGTLGIQQGTGSGVPATGFSLISSSGNFFELKTTTGIANSKLANIDLSGLTNNTTRTYTLPDASGTIALTSNLSAYVPYTGANNSVDLGVYSLSADTVNGVGIFSVGSGTQSGFIGIKQGTTFLGNISGYNSINANATKFILTSDVGSTNYKSASFQLGSLTNNTERTFTLPDLSGTLALLEGTQTFSGAKTFSALSNFDNVIRLKQNLASYSTSSGYTTLFSTEGGGQYGFGFYNGGGALNSLNFTTASSNTYTFPSSSGTIALTSNLSTYVPYTGATTNVNLGVYSLTANQVIAGGAGVNNAGTFTTYDGGVATQLIGSTGNLKFFPLWNPSIGARINAENSAGSAYIPLSFYASNFYFHSNVNFNSTIGNGTYSYTLPSATGTLALTSQIPANPVGGTGTTNYLPKFTGASTIGNSQIFDNGTNVGINTSTITAIGGAITTLEIKGTSANNTRSGGIRLSSNDNTLNALMYFESSKLIFGTESNNPITFTTNNSTKMTLDSSGNLGLGVTPSASSLPTIESDYGLFVGKAENNITSNAYFNASWKYTGSGFATRYSANSYVGQHAWYTAPSGTAGNAISFTQAMTLFANGNLAVGTTTDAGYKLDVNGTGRFSGNLAIAGQTLSAWGGNFGVMQSYYGSYFGGTTGGGTVMGNNNYFDGTNYKYINTDFAGQIQIGGGNILLRVAPSGTAGNNVTYTNALTIASTGAATFSSSVTTNVGIIGNNSNHLYLSSNSSGGEISFWANQLGTRLMTITGGGNVGIGTSSPSERFVVSTNSAVAAKLMGSVGAGATNNTQLRFFGNHSNTDLWAIGTEVATGSTDRAFDFYDLVSGANRMRITSGGVTLFGGTTFTTITSAVLGATNPSFTGRNWSFGPNSSGDYVVYHNQGGNTGVYLSYGGSSWTSNSDENIKDIIEIIPNALESIINFRAVKFYWKGDESKKENIGLIAQDVQKSYPELIDKQIFDDKEILGVRYTELIPVLVKAIQEQQAQIEELKELIKNK